jgi:hypothetical protein
MGWTCHYTPPRDERAEIERLVTFETEDRAMRPVFTTRKGSVWYLAVEVTAKTEAADPYGYEVDALGRYVFAAVILTRKDNGEWCYKDMEESMGPCEAQAPQIAGPAIAHDQGVCARVAREMQGICRPHRPQDCPRRHHPACRAVGV